VPCDAGSSTNGPGATECAECAEDAYCVGGAPAEDCPEFSSSQRGSVSEDDCYCILGFEDDLIGAGVNCILRTLQWFVKNLTIAEDAEPVQFHLFTIRSLVTDTFTYNVSLAYGDEDIFLVSPEEAEAPQMPKGGESIAVGHVTLEFAPDMYGETRWEVKVSDPSYIGGPPPVNELKQAFIWVLPVNDAPSFDFNDTSFFITADSGLKFFTWAFNISSGPNELDQRLSFKVVQLLGPKSADGTDYRPIFTELPHVGTDGLLELSVGPELGFVGSGNTSWEIVLVDDGGRERDGEDHSKSSTITIEVLKRPAKVKSLQLRQTSTTPSDVEILWGLEDNGLLNAASFHVTIANEEYEQVLKVNQNNCHNSGQLPCSVVFEGVMDVLPGGARLYAKASAENLAGSSDVVQTQPKLLVGEPSEPRSVTISQSASLSDDAISKTKFSISWAAPQDYGDKRHPSDALRVVLVGYRLSMTCADGEEVFVDVKATITSLNLDAIWRGDNFDLMDRKTQLMTCRKGDTLSVQIRASNSFFSGAFSNSTSLDAMGLPGAVRELSASEVTMESGNALNVTFKLPSDTGFGDESAEITHLVVKASLCKSFDATMASCEVSEIKQATRNSREQNVLLYSLTVGSVYYVQAAVSNLVGSVQEYAVVPILADYFVMPNLADASLVRIALPYSTSDDYHVWRNGVQDTSIKLQIFSLPTALQNDDEMTGAFEFGSTIKSVRAPLQARSALGARSVVLPLLTELPVSCYTGCSATLKVYPTSFPSKIVAVQVQYFVYARPQLLSMYPNTGSEQGGSLVKLVVKEFAGDKNQPSRCMTNLFCLLSSHPALQVEIVCAGSTESKTRTLAVKKKEDGEFDLSFLTPQCSEGTANFTLATVEGNAVDLNLGDQRLQFRYKGTVVSSVTPPSGMTNIGSGGVSINVFIDNVQAEPKESISMTLAGEICTVEQSSFSQGNNRLFVRVATPELPLSQAGPVLLLVTGVLPGKILTFTWTYLPPPAMFLEAESWKIGGDARTWVSATTTALVDIEVTIANLNPIFGRKFDALSLDIPGAATAMRSFSPRGKKVVATFSLDPSSLTAGRSYSVGVCVLFEGVCAHNVSSFDIPTRSGAWLEARDTSQPRLVTLAPSEAPVSGGALVMLGFTEAASLQEEFADGAVDFSLGSTAGTVLHAISLTDYNARGAAYETAGSKAAYFSRASENLFREYMAVPAALADAVAQDGDPVVAATKATLLLVQTPEAGAGMMEASVVWDKAGVQQIFTASFTVHAFPSGTPIVEVIIPKTSILIFCSSLHSSRDSASQSKLKFILRF